MLFKRELSRRIIVLPPEVKAAATRATRTFSPTLQAPAPSTAIDVRPASTNSPAQTSPASTAIAAGPSDRTSSRASTTTGSASSSVSLGLLSPSSSAASSSASSDPTLSDSSSSSNLLLSISSSTSGFLATASSTAAAQQTGETHTGSIIAGVAGGALLLGLILVVLLWMKRARRDPQRHSHHPAPQGFAGSLVSEKSWIPYKAPADQERKSMDSEDERLDPEEVGPWDDIALDASRPPVNSIVPRGCSDCSGHSHDIPAARSTRSTDMLRKVLGNSLSDDQDRPFDLPAAKRATGGFFKSSSPTVTSPVPQGSLFPPPSETAPLVTRSPLSLVGHDSRYPDTAAQRRAREAAEAYFARARARKAAQTFVPRDSAPPLPAALPKAQVSDIERTTARKGAARSSGAATAGIGSTQPTVSNAQRQTAATMSTWARDPSR